MSKCPRCNTLCRPEDRYCGKCGEYLGNRSSDRDGLRTQKSIEVSDIRHKLGVVYFKKGQYAKAVEIWRKVLQDAPDNLEVKTFIEKAEQAMKENR